MHLQDFTVPSQAFQQSVVCHCSPPRNVINITFNHELYQVKYQVLPSYKEEANVSPLSQVKAGCSSRFQEAAVSRLKHYRGYKLSNE